mgnify:CR=1 FL=1
MKAAETKKNNRAYIKLSCDTWAQRVRMWFEKRLMWNPMKSTDGVERK